MPLQHPLPESIGDPDLLVGREKEFNLLDPWIGRIPRRVSKSRALLGRRKSGKTAIVQRIFNRLWSDNGPVIPFYMQISEKKTWLADFAVEFFCRFASQYISFETRDPRPVRAPLGLKQIKEWAISNSFSLLETDVDAIFEHRENKSLDLLWNLASSCPHRLASAFDRRVLVIIDEFQNTGEYIYMDPEHRIRDESIPGTWHDLSESKYAPMLVTGSYVGWLINIIDTYLEAGRLKRQFINPYLQPEFGLQAVFKYSEHCDQPISNETAVLINHLCMSDPFFISCVIQSEFEAKDLTTEEGVVNAVHHEITDRLSEMSMTWGEYIELSLKRINTVNSKRIMLHLSKHSDREWTPKELKQELRLEIDENEIKKLLQNMVKADLIQRGSTDIRYQGLTDGTLCLILRQRFEEEIATFDPNVEITDLKQNFYEEIQRLKKEKRSLQGLINHLSGMMAEYLLCNEFRSKKRFRLSRYFENVKDDAELNITDATMRVKFQRPDGKAMEIDVLAASACGRLLAVEVKKTQALVGLPAVEDFLEKARILADLRPDNVVLPAFFSVGGFKDDAMKCCEEGGIAVATEIELF